MNTTTIVKVELNKQDLIEMIEANLRTKGLPASVKKIQYDSDLKTILVESSESVGPRVEMKFEPKKERNNPGGHRKRNVGFFKNAQELIDNYRDKHHKSIPLKELVKDIKFFYPNMSEPLIIQYLHDKRQLPGVEVKTAEGVAVI